MKLFGTHVGTLCDVYFSKVNCQTMWTYYLSYYFLTKVSLISKQFAPILGTNAYMFQRELSSASKRNITSIQFNCLLQLDTLGTWWGNVKWKFPFRDAICSQETAFKNEQDCVWFKRCLWAIQHNTSWMTKILLKLITTFSFSMENLYHYSRLFFCKTN